MKRTSSLLLAPILTFGLASCGYKVVRKPAVDVVKKLAIISVYSNRGLKNVDNAGGANYTQALSLLGSLAGKKEEKTPQLLQPDFGGTRLVEHALSEYIKALNSLGRWQVVSPDQLKENAAYQAFAQKKMDELNQLGTAIGALAKTQWTTVPGMPVYVLEDEVEKSQKMKELTALCAQLGVDAVAVVYVDIAYRTHTGVGGGAGMTGSAVAEVFTKIRAVTREGKFAINSTLYGKPAKSSAKTLMVAGNINFTDKTEAMYKEAISKHIAALKEVMLKEL